MTNLAESLLAKIDERTATVGIVGLGYVGLPLALLFAEKGFAVLGFDVDPVKIDALERGNATSVIWTADALRPRRLPGAF